MHEKAQRLALLVAVCCWMTSVSQGEIPSASVEATVSIVSSPDSDGDGLTDANEAWLGTLSNRSDTDGDGLTDGEEFIKYRTDPLQPDTDGDGLPDGWEVRHGLSPLSIVGRDGAPGDPDEDASDNHSEYMSDTDPTNALSRLQITGFRILPNGFVIDWSGGILATQYLQIRGALTPEEGGWTDIFTNLPPTATSTNIIDAGATNKTLFYRIRAER